ncbi:MAG: hypothetical protein ABS76_19075 [Pelagibacterium sp. SCN 64-44]|nr:MAG: hypothetical protein ABS76_19075 [Pelagibacterium sp. SCN 64-44]
MLLLTGLLAACSVARPVGDFGRAEPGVIHDAMMPAVGRVIAANRREPVSDFNRTDQENQMHDRVWRFLVAPHAQDWLFDGSAELQRTRISPPRADTRYTVERYYNWLRRTPYQSSRTRYATVGAHIAADLGTAPTTFAAICAVIEIDRQRATAYQGLAIDLPPALGENMQARKYENDAFIAWFVRALSYRYSSYSYALDSLLVETPHEQSMAVDESLRRLSGYVARANRGDFCGGTDRAGAGSGIVIPSRFQNRPDGEVVAQK